MELYSDDHPSPFASPITTGRNYLAEIESFETSIEGTCEPAVSTAREQALRVARAPSEAHSDHLQQALHRAVFDHEFFRLDQHINSIQIIEIPNEKVKSITKRGSEYIRQSVTAILDTFEALISAVPSHHHQSREGPL